MTRMNNVVIKIKNIIKKRNQQPHIFLHLHKSGGTSLMNCIDVNYKKDKIHVIDGTNYRNSYDDFKNESLEYREKINLLRGHHFFGSHTYLRNNAIYFTMLREPIARLCSLYNYLREINLYQEINEEEMSLRDFLESGLAMAADNGMTRMLTNNDFDKIGNGKIDTASAEEAIYNLENKCLAVGITEEFETSLKLFKEKLNWSFIPKFNLDNKTTTKKKSYKEVDDFFKKNKDMKRFIEADLKVYNYAKKRFLDDKAKYL